MVLKWVREGGKWAAVADLAGSVIAHLQGLIDTRVLWELPRETGPASN